MFDDRSAWEDVAWPSDDGSTIQTYERRLPHWRLEGAVYYVTFRLGDSIPREILKAWAVERQTWLAAHGVNDSLPKEEQRRLYLAIPEELRRAFERSAARSFFVELDRCYGACVLRRPEVARIVSDALRYHDGVRFHCGDFVVMPNHVHWLLAPLQGWELQEILKSVKSFTARRINNLIGKEGSLWQRETFDHLVRDPRHLEGIRNYIQQNPLKAGLNHGEYTYYRTAGQL